MPLVVGYFIRADHIPQINENVRLAFVTSEYPTESSMSGGLAAYLGRICPWLVSAGHDVHVFTRSLEAGVLTVGGVQVHRVVPWWSRSRILDRFDRLVPRAAYMAFQDIKAAWALRRAVVDAHDNSPFDTIQLSNVMATGLFMNRTLPTVMRLSSFKPDCVRANGGADSLNERIRLRLEGRSIRRHKKYIFAPSFLVAQRVEEEYRLKPSVIETPFSPGGGAPDCSILNQLDPTRPYALYFGRLSRLKGLVVLADALPRILNSIPQFRLVLAGTDSQTAPGGGSIREYLMSKAGSHGNRLTFLSQLSHDQLFPVISSAHCVVLPSLADNLPNAAIESMWCERVVIGSTVASFDQLICDGNSGLLIEPTQTSIERALVTAWHLSAADRQRIGREAKKRVDSMSLENLMPQLLQYYQAVADARTDGRDVHQISIAS